MLFADKNALRTQLKVNMLRIRERELLYYTNNCLAISTSAALLAGFAWYGLTEVPFDSNASAVTQTMYLVITTLIMGLELLTVVNATLCAILGPGLALRGPDGSMHNAVQGMMTHYRFTLACFTLGLICFMLSALLYAWMQFDWTLALPMTLLIIYFLFILCALPHLSVAIPFITGNPSRLAPRERTSSHLSCPLLARVPARGPAAHPRRTHTDAGSHPGAWSRRWFTPRCLARAVLDPVADGQVIHPVVACSGHHVTLVSRLSPAAQPSLLLANLQALPAASRGSGDRSLQHTGRRNLERARATVRPAGARADGATGARVRSADGRAQGAVRPPAGISPRNDGNRRHMIDKL